MQVFVEEDIRVKYSSLWNDVISIQINLLHGKLRQFFENILNLNKNKLNQFYKYFSCNRKFCVKLPNNGDHYNVPLLCDLNVWFEMIEKFDDDNVIIRTRRRIKELEMFDIGNLNHIYTFIVLWNGIFSMMHQQDANYRHGLVTAIKEMKFDRCVQ